MKRLGISISSLDKFESLTTFSFFKTLKSLYGATSGTAKTVLVDLFAPNHRLRCKIFTVDFVILRLIYVECLNFEINTSRVSFLFLDSRNLQESRQMGNRETVIVNLCAPNHQLRCKIFTVYFVILLLT
jgi:hypothetical protein